MNYSISGNSCQAIYGGKKRIELKIDFPYTNILLLSYSV